MKHERQTRIEGWDQEAVDGTQVVIVGAGATGSANAKACARVGFGRITIIDPDTLEEHNLENQSFTHADIGRPKVEALAEQLRAIDASLDVRPFIGRFEDYQGDLGADWILGCVDNVATRHYLNYYAVLNDTPLIDSGIDRYRAVVKTVLPGRTACQSCYPTLARRRRKASCSSDPIPSTYLVANAAAMLQTTALQRLLMGESFHPYVELDLARQQLNQLHMPVNPECDLCVEKQRRHFVGPPKPLEAV